MKNLLAPIFVVAIVLGVVALFACAEDDVGIPCEIANIDPDAGSSSSQVNGQAMDCRSRVCLFYSGSGSRPMCTKTCDKDSDCPGPGEIETCPNNERFVCVPAVQTGSLKCCKMCVCKAFVSEEARKKLESDCASVSTNCPKL